MEQPHGKRANKRKCPIEDANVFSLLFFWWINDTLKLGSRRPLLEEDLFPLQKNFKAEKLVNKLEMEWLKATSACRPRSKHPRLWQVMFRLFSREKYFLMAALKFTHSASSILLPLMVWYFLMRLSEGDDVKHGSALPYVFGICIMAVLKGILHHHCFFLGDLCGLQANVAVIGLIYKKILTLNRRSLNKIASGNTINLVSNDANHLKDAGWSLMFLFFAPLEIVSSGILAWHLIGWQALVGASFFLVVIAYISLMSSQAGTFRERAASITDKRLHIMDEIIIGIRTVKMHAREWNLRDLVRKWRRKELGFIRLRGAIISSFDALYFTNTPIAGFVSVITLLLTNNHLTSFQIFTLLSILNAIKFSVSVSIGETLHLLADVKVALERIQTFLEEGSSIESKEWCRKVFKPEEIGTRLNDVEMSTRLNDVEIGTRLNDDEIGTSLNDGEISTRLNDGEIGTRLNDGEIGAKLNDGEIGCFGNTIFANVHEGQEVGRTDPLWSPVSCTEAHIQLTNVSCNWREAAVQDTLQNISLTVSSKQLFAITGPAGCGKSSLLKTILGELPHHRGEIKQSGSIVYVPQIPCVFSGTVQDNIVFGKELDRVKYQRIIEACNLQKDIDLFPKKDLTNIGERGASLSGGQQARICLARALYTDADIFLLDDPFSAVDAQVGSHLFTECILGLLADRICVLVTHQVQYLKNADEILVIQHGSVVRQGKYLELRDEDILSTSIIAGKVGKSKEPKRKPPFLQRRISSRSSFHFRGELSVMADLSVQREDRMFGSVRWTVYWHYFRSALPGLLMFLLAFLIVFVQVFMVSPYWWLARIAAMSPDQQKDPVTLAVYGALVFGALLLSTAVSFLFFHAVLRAAEILHDKMVTAVVKAPVLFFDTNPAGRILNRFSKDTSCMDDTLPPQFLLAVQLCLFSLAATLLSAATNYWLFIGVAPLILLFVYFARYYLKTSRELMRLEAITCSPMYSHISDTVMGLEVIRSSGMEDRFLQEFYSHQDHNTSAIVMVLGSSKWLGVRMEVLCSLLVTLVAVGAVFVTQNPALAGLSLSYALETLDAAQFGVKLLSETENLMTSVERVMSYAQLTSEPGYATDELPPDSWPSTGSLSLEDVSLRYAGSFPPALKDVKLDIQAKEKVGVVGRTGAGKSSILAALLRMPEPKGKVLVDGIDIGTLNIQAARRTFTVISQDPVLFAGSLRSNLDPFDSHTDQELWETLEEMKLKQWVDRLPGKLNYELIEFGSNLSVGERQLVCLAHALLQRNKIVILDEATANVDFKTDRLIQELIRDKFPDSTVVTIAHRLDTIFDYDRVMILDRGRVVEFDKPNVLLKKTGGYFSELVKSYNNNFE